MMWSVSYLRVPTIALVSCYCICSSLGAESDVAQNPEAPQQLQDRTLQLSGGAGRVLSIPGGFQLQGKTTDVLVNFHGHPPLACRSVRAAGLNCVVISINYKGLSSSYRLPFSEDRQLFEKILNEALEGLRAEPDFPNDAQWGQVVVSSFSAGFGAVREILKTQSYFDRLAGIYLVDSLYCGYVGDGTETVREGIVHPGLMKDFLRFAKAAANGEKVMIVTHCVGPTPGYASTLETADYLLENLKLKPQPVDIAVTLPSEAEVAPGNLRLYRQARRKGFSLYGSPGPIETDHVEHLRHMAYWLPGLPLAKRRADLDGLDAQ